MKSIHYVATVTKVYRQAFDAYEADPEHFMVRQEWLDELEKISHRPYTRGFSVSRPTAADQVYSQSSNTQTHDFIGLVKSYDEEKGLAWVEQRNHFKLGQTVEFLQPKGHLVRYTIDRIVDEDGQELDAARHAQQLVGLAVPERLEPYSMMRRQVKRPMFDEDWVYFQALPSEMTFINRIIEGCDYLAWSRPWTAKRASASYGRRRTRQARRLRYSNRCPSRCAS
mgnify:CR=1 FL=1